MVKIVVIIYLVTTFAVVLCGASADTENKGIVKLEELRISGNVPLVKTGEFHMVNKRFAPAVVVAGNLVYVIGGQGSNGKVLRSIERFDTKTGESKLLSEMKIPRLWHRAVAVGNKIYILGGVTPASRYVANSYFERARSYEARTIMGIGERFDSPGETYENRLAPLRLEDSVEVLDLQTGKVDEHGKMPEARAEFGCVAVDGRLFVIGGKHRYKNRRISFTNRVDVYDLAMGTWTLGIPMPVAAGVDATVVDGPFVIVAGSYNGAHTLDTMFAFNPLNKTWNIAPAMCRGSSAHSTVFLGKYLFLFGNYEAPEQILVYNLKNKDSETFTLKYTPARHGGAVAVDGKIYVFGGKRHRVAEPMDEIQVFDTTGKRTGPER